MAKAVAVRKPTAPTNAFVNRPKPPTDAELATALGPSKPFWDQLLADLATECKVTIREWHSYSHKAGWSLRAKHAERTILYLSPYAGGFRTSFALGDKAVQAARQSSLPPRVLQIIKEAKKYAEGTAVRIDVRSTADVAAVKQLAMIKLKN
jgi:Protein of unknown function (DUF3788)